MFKIVCLLKRRQGMSVEEFRSYNESQHVALFDGVFDRGVERYWRRYLTPFTDPATGATIEGFDELMELWFNDKSVFEELFIDVQETEFRRLVAEDEAKLFDVDASQWYIIDEENDSELKGSQGTYP
jgi:hypothetical protein